MFKNILSRILWTTVLVISLLVVLSFVWDVPTYMGYQIPAEFAKLPVTIFLIMGLIAGLAGTWSDREVSHTPDHIVTPTPREKPKKDPYKFEEAQK